jgi:hypothetical protein
MDVLVQVSGRMKMREDREVTVTAFDEPRDYLILPDQIFLTTTAVQNGALHA